MKHQKIFLLLIIWILGCFFPNPLSAGGNKEFKVVSEFAAVKMVYISPDGLKDKAYINQVLNGIMAKYDKNRPIQVMFFDNLKFTPKKFPMTDDQIRHQKAQYNKNPKTGFEEFVWF